MLISPSKSRDLTDENNKILTEWKRFETTVLLRYMCGHIIVTESMAPDMILIQNGGVFAKYVQYFMNSN